MLPSNQDYIDSNPTPDRTPQSHQQQPLPLPLPLPQSQLQQQRRFSAASTLITSQSLTIPVAAPREPQSSPFTGVMSASPSLQAKSSVVATSTAPPPISTVSTASSVAAASPPSSTNKPRRTTTTPSQTNVLLKVFKLLKFPPVDIREDLAEILKMTPHQVQVWFQNRRQRSKPKPKSNDSAALTTATDSTQLSEKNSADENGGAAEDDSAAAEETVNLSKAREYVDGLKAAIAKQAVIADNEKPSMAITMEAEADIAEFQQDHQPMQRRIQHRNSISNLNSITNSSISDHPAKDSSRSSPLATVYSSPDKIPSRLTTCLPVSQTVRHQQQQPQQHHQQQPQQPPHQQPPVLQNLPAPLLQQQQQTPLPSPFLPRMPSTYHQHGRHMSDPFILPFRHIHHRNLLPSRRPHAQSESSMSTAPLDPITTSPSVAPLLPLPSMPHSNESGSILESGYVHRRILPTPRRHSTIGIPMLHANNGHSHLADRADTEPTQLLPPIDPPRLQQPSGTESPAIRPTVAGVQLPPIAALIDRISPNRNQQSQHQYRPLNRHGRLASNYIDSNPTPDRTPQSHQQQPLPLPLPLPQSQLQQQRRFSAASTLITSQSLTIPVAAPREPQSSPFTGVMSASPSLQAKSSVVATSTAPPPISTVSTTASVAAASPPSSTNKPRRTTTTPSQTNVLLKVFKLLKFPPVDIREDLAEILKMTPHQVQVWFQNRRQRSKPKPKSNDSAALTTATDSTQLSEKNSADENGGAAEDDSAAAEETVNLSKAREYVDGLKAAIAKQAVIADNEKPSMAITMEAEADIAEFQQDHQPMQRRIQHRNSISNLNSITNSSISDHPAKDSSRSSPLATVYSSPDKIPSRLTTCLPVSQTVRHQQQQPQQHHQQQPQQPPHQQPPVLQNLPAPLLQQQQQTPLPSPFLPRMPSTYHQHGRHMSDPFILPFRHIHHRNLLPSRRPHAQSESSMSTAPLDPITTSPSVAPLLPLPSMPHSNESGSILESGYVHRRILPTPRRHSTIGIPMLHANNGHSHLADRADTEPTQLLPPIDPPRLQQPSGTESPAIRPTVAGVQLPPIAALIDRISPNRNQQSQHQYRPLNRHGRLASSSFSGFHPYKR
ncbi:homeobox-domain-containing protein [Ramicandelaber brevisporus]|nr:homeobox-domain-containing protein [Ramicandelaber brevisporus]